MVCTQETPMTAIFVGISCQLEYSVLLFLEHRALITSVGLLNLILNFLISLLCLGICIKKYSSKNV